MRAAGAGLEARPVPLLVHLPEPHRRRQEVEGRGGLGQRHRHRVKAADRMLLVHGRFPPGHPAIVRGLAHQLELDAVGIAQGQRVGAEPAHLLVVNPELSQAVGPEVERAARHLERHRRDLTAAGVLLRPGRPAEESHRGARRAEVVAEIDVVGVREVLVDALFDEAQPEHADVEVDALLDVGGDARHVVNAGNAGGHVPSDQIIPCTHILVRPLSSVT